MSIPVRDFLISTREHRMSGLDDLLNEATLRNYWFLNQMWRDNEKRVSGGDSLIDHIQGETQGNTQFRNPKKTTTVTNRDVLTDVSLPWAFSQNGYSLINEAKSLNAGDPTKFVDYVKAQEQAQVTDIANFIEAALWALPNNETMEQTVADDLDQAAYSIFAFLTRDGMAPTALNGGLAPGSSPFTQIETVSPEEKDWWRNAVDTYSSANASNPEEGIISAFDRMVHRVQYDVTDTLTPYAQSTSKKKKVIVTNIDGCTAYKRALRAVNDQLVHLHDPSIMGPQYCGIPIKEVAQLNNVGWTEGQPDYLWLDMEHLYPVINGDNFMKETITPGGPDHANKTVVHKFTHYQLFCRSRRRLGRISAA